jgi:alpha/beta superfamily hydrolase
MSSSLLRGHAEQVFVPGPAGRIEVVIDAAETESPRGVAVVAHPHPLYGGALDNKVAQTLARVLAGLGYTALRPNFRGVGETEGAHDHGRGETDDILAVVAYARERFGAGRAAELSVVLAGYSFGAHVQTMAAARLRAESRDVERLVLVAPAAGFVSGGRAYEPLTIPANTIVIHGEQDSTVPLANVFDWLRPQDVPVTVIPGTDHFFHRKLGIIKAIVAGQWH